MKLIDKDAVVAEIEKRVEAHFKKMIEYRNAVNIGGASIELLLRDNDKSILSFLNTLEVKEVDLDEDVDRILDEFDWNYDKIDFYEFAKHFFELGLKVAQKGECV